MACSVFAEATADQVLELLVQQGDDDSGAAATLVFEAAGVASDGSGGLAWEASTPDAAAKNKYRMMGAMLNELEHAHIYIEELHGENAALSAEVAAERALNAAQADQIAALSARLDALEGN